MVGIIPKVYGHIRLSGNVIWATDIRETDRLKEETIKGGHNVITTRTHVNYEYYVTIAIAICEGKINEVTRVWAGDRIINLKDFCKSYNVYLGSSDQMPDPVISRHKDQECCPAYRDLCYIVIEDFALGSFDNHIPNFSFEVRRELRFKPAVEDKIKEVVLIPGAGEFVYSDIIRTKHHGYTVPFGGFVITDSKEQLNMHKYENRANVLLALDQMQRTLPNLEWVALVVTWFATSSNASTCRIVSKVEYSPKGIMVKPDDWSVAGITREKAELVLRFDEHTPTYGGIPSDDTVIAICRELRKRGLKVMLYPMIFVDEIKPKTKPWRGRIKANSRSEIEHWFRYC